MTVRIIFLFAILCVPIVNSAKAQSTLIPIGEIQQYSPDTGAPISPHSNQIVTVEGVVYVTAGTYSAGGRYIQGPTGGINVFEEGQPYFQLGDSVRVTGVVWEWNEEYYIDNPTMTLLGHGDVPRPQRRTIQELKNGYHHVGGFCEVVGDVVSMGINQFVIVQAQDSITVAIDPDTAVDISAVQIGDRYLVVSPCFKSASSVYLSPRDQNDLVENPEPIQYVVTPSGEGDAPTIQAAIDAAAPGDAIILDGDLFSGDGNTEIIVPDKDLVIRSMSGDPQFCTIDCDDGEAGERFGFMFDEHVTSATILRGISVSGGYAVRDTAAAGILLDGWWFEGDGMGARPILEDCRIVNNNGHGLVIKGSADGLILRNCLFMNNAGDGVTMPSLLAANSYGLYQLESCQFIDNGGRGLHLDMWRCQVQIDDCDFIGNASDGVYVYGDPAVVGTRDSRFINNGGYGSVVYSGPGALAGSITIAIPIRWSSYYGGCIYEENGVGGINATEASQAHVDSCVIIGNMGPGVSSSGWGVSTIVRHSVIAQNVGHGVHVIGTAHEPTVIEYSTIADNYGDGLVSQTVQMTQAIIASNLGQPLSLTDTASAQIANVNIYGHQDGDWQSGYSDMLGVAGNISEDPRFCGGSENMYALAADSPCLPENQIEDGVLIGAMSLGCNGELPRIVSVSDVPR